MIYRFLCQGLSIQLLVSVCEKKAEVFDVIDNNNNDTLRVIVIKKKKKKTMF